MSLDTCDMLFRKVRQGKSLPEICHALQPIFDTYELISLGLERGAVFWRARLCQEAPWQSLQDMGAPPQGIAAAGRFNDPAESLLYTSLRVETALSEVSACSGQLVQVIGYRTILDKYLRLAVVGELMHVHKLGYMRFTGSDPDQSISRLVNNLGQSRGKDILYIDAFLHSLLADSAARECDYIFTRAVAAMIHRDPEIDGIAFSSTKDSLGYNVILRPESIASKVHGTSCFQCRISAIREFGFIDFETLREVIRLREDDTFEWADPLPTPRRRFFNLTKEEYKIALQLADDPNSFLEMTRAHK